MSSKRVVIAGGGFASLEAALALRALAGTRAEVTLISPNTAFTYRPVATIEAFDDAPPLRFDLAAIASDLGAAYHHTAVEAVAAEQQWVSTDRLS